MATYNKIEDFVNQFCQGNHDFNADRIDIYLSNAAPSVSADAVKADIAEITNENGYTAPVDTQNTFSETTGTGTVAATAVRCRR